MDTLLSPHMRQFYSEIWTPRGSQVFSSDLYSEFAFARASVVPASLRVCPCRPVLTGGGATCARIAAAAASASTDGSAANARTAAAAASASTGGSATAARIAGAAASARTIASGANAKSASAGGLSLPLPTHSLETLGRLHYLICTTLSLDVVIIGL